MKALKSLISQYWLLVAGALLGQAVGGLPGMVLGLVCGLLVEMSWRLFARRDEVAALYRKAKVRDEGKSHVHDQTGIGSRNVLWAFVVACLLLPSYCILLLAGADTRGLSSWIELFQPGVDALGSFIPAISNIASEPARLSHLIPILQHVLLVGWLIAFSMMAWFAIDILAVNRARWVRFPGMTNRADRREFGTSCLVMFSIAFSMMFFGLLPGAKSYIDFLFSLLLLAAGSVAMIASLFGLFLWLGYIVSRSRSAAIQTVEQREAMETVRALKGIMQGKASPKTE